MPGLYLHIPFCAHACPYCDFSFVLLAGAPMPRFLKALDVEIESCRRSLAWKNTRFASIFVGGGTPTSLPVRFLEQILGRLHETFDLAPDAEITVEANPETLTDAKLAMMRANGVNRLSIGVQAFTPTSLEQLGRHHSVERAKRAVRQARAAGFPQISVDLMFGAPGQTLDDWNETLTTAVRLSPDHISTYGLTIEEETVFGRRRREGKLELPDENTHVALYDRAIDVLAQHGYRHYEVSNFARPGAECRHNLIYWTGGDYLGLGPSAHSHHKGRRYANVRSVADYIARLETAQSVVDFEERPTREQRIYEAILLGLRLSDGLDIDMFRRQFGENAFRSRKSVIDRLEKTGWVERTGSRLRLTRQGLAVADTVCAEIM